LSCNCPALVLNVVIIIVNGKLKGSESPDFTTVSVSFECDVCRFHSAVI